MRSPWGSADAGVTDASEPRRATAMSAKSANLVIKIIPRRIVEIEMRKLVTPPVTILPNLSLAAWT